MGCKNSKNIIKKLDDVDKIRYQCAVMISQININIYNAKILEEKINKLDVSAKTLSLKYKDKPKDEIYYLELKRLNENIIKLKTNINI